MNINEMAMTLKIDDLHLGSKGTEVCDLDLQCCGLGPYGCQWAGIKCDTPAICTWLNYRNG